MSKDFTKVPNKLIRDTNLKVIDKAIYAVIRSHANGKTDLDCYPSISTVASFVPCSSRQVTRSIKNLKDAGHLTTRARLGTTPQYIFSDSGGDAYVATPKTPVSTPQDNSVGDDWTPMSTNQEFNKNYLSKPQLRYLTPGTAGFRVAELVGHEIFFKKTPTLKRELYQNTDDSLFVYGTLKGFEAKEAALRDHVASLENDGNMSLPIDGDLPSSETSSLTT